MIAARAARAVLTWLRTWATTPPPPEHIGGPAWDCPACHHDHVVDSTCPAQRKET